MNRSEQEFWNSRLTKIIKMIEMYVDKKMIEAEAYNGKQYNSKYFNGKENVKTVKSLTEIEGWKNGK